MTRWWGRDPVTRIALEDDDRHVIYVGKPMWRTAVFWVGVLLVCASVILAVISSARSSEAERHTTNVLKAQASIAKQQATLAKDQATLAKAQAAEAAVRATELRKAFCGLLVPIGGAPISDATSALGRTLITAARTGAIDIGCPGGKP